MSEPQVFILGMMFGIIFGAIVAAIVAKPYIENAKCNQRHGPIILNRDPNGLTVLDFNSKPSGGK